MAEDAVTALIGMGVVGSGGVDSRVVIDRDGGSTVLSLFCMADADIESEERRRAKCGSNVSKAVTFETRSLAMPGPIALLETDSM